MATLADWFKSQTKDYGQLKDAYPNAKKFGSALKQNVSKLVPTTEDFQSPQKMGEWSMAAAMNAPMGLSLNAYHASPHKFDTFDMSKIGTGEGNQAYGHGLYLAENPKTTEQYLVNQESDLTPQGRATGYIRDYMNDYDGALHGARNRINFMQNHSQESKQLQHETVKALENKDYGGHVYESSIEWPDKLREDQDPLGKHHLLDWDNLLSNQSDYVKNKLNDYKQLGGNLDINDSMTGKDIYNSLVKEKAKQHNLTPMDIQKATKKGSELADWLGIPGVKYLDGDSRQAGHGTSNYVMFNDQYPKITKRSNKLSDYFKGYD